MTEAAMRRRWAEWRYTRDGRVKHALRHSTDALSLCGVGPWVSSEWRGTGSQAEYERRAMLPECRRCARYLTD